MCFFLYTRCRVAHSNISMMRHAWSQVAHPSVEHFSIGTVCAEERGPGPYLHIADACPEILGYLCLLRVLHNHEGAVEGFLCRS